MTSSDDFGVRFTRAWVALYTSSLPEATGKRRRAEIESDLWEQLNDSSSDRASVRILDRCLRGVPADVWWRYRTLLEQRGARQRSQNMSRTIFTSWWGVLTAVLAVAVLTEGVAGVAFGDGDVVRVVSAATSIATGGLIFGGLAILHRRRRAGSWMIAGGTALSSLGMFLIPLAVLTMVGGLWTGNLQLSSSPRAPHLQTARPQPVDVTTRWYLWLVTSLLLFVFGLGALVVLGDGQTAAGEDDTSLLGGLAWFAWILSWLGAVISTGVGVALGAKRGIARHRTRPA